MCYLVTPIENLSLNFFILFPESSEAKFWYQNNGGHKAQILRRFSFSQLQFTHRWRTRPLLSELRKGKKRQFLCEFHFLRTDTKIVV